MASFLSSSENMDSQSSGWDDDMEIDKCEDSSTNWQVGQFVLSDPFSTEQILKLIVISTLS